MSAPGDVFFISYPFPSLPPCVVSVVECPLWSFPAHCHYRRYKSNSFFRLPRSSPCVTKSRSWEAVDTFSLVVNTVHSLLRPSSCKSSTLSRLSVISTIDRRGPLTGEPISSTTHFALKPVQSPLWSYSRRLPTLVEPFARVGHFSSSLNVSAWQSSSPSSILINITPPAFVGTRRCSSNLVIPA